MTDSPRARLDPTDVVPIRVRAGSILLWRSVRARPGRLSGLSVFHSESFLYGTFV